MDPLFAATGVKNLHEKAEHYDIGIYLVTVILYQLVVVVPTFYHTSI